MIAVQKMVKQHQRKGNRPLHRIRGEKLEYDDVQEGSIPDVNPRFLQSGAQYSGQVFTQAEFRIFNHLLIPNPYPKHKPIPNLKPNRNPNSGAIIFHEMKPLQSHFWRWSKTNNVGSLKPLPPPPHSVLFVHLYARPLPLKATPISGV